MNSSSYVEDLFERAIVAVEIDAHKGENFLEFHHIDPANEYGDGYVEVSVGDYTVVYEQ